MANPAVGKLLHVNAVFPHKFEAVFAGFGVRETHTEDVVTIADLPLRVIMAVETPAHLQAGRPPHQRHLVNATVAALTADPLGHMNAVVEVNKVGQVMDTRPFQRPAGAVAFSDRLENRAVLPDLRMTTHADFGGWEPGKRRRLDRRVAEAAVNPQAAYMVFMAERDRLLADDIGFGDVRRATEPIPSEGHRRKDPQATEDGDLRKRVHARMENLGHRHPDIEQRLFNIKWSS